MAKELFYFRPGEGPQGSSLGIGADADRGKTREELRSDIFRMIMKLKDGAQDPEKKVSQAQERVRDILRRVNQGGFSLKSHFNITLEELEHLASVNEQ
jgi:hypothetical protein